MFIFRKTKKTFLSKKIVGVCGSSHNIGVTSFCIALCNYICNKCGCSAAYIELNATDEIYMLNLKKSHNCFSHNNIDFFPSVTLATLQDILRRNYNFFILDFGVLNPFTINEYERCNLQYAICPTLPWKRNEFYKFIQMFKNNNSKFQDNITFIGYSKQKEIHSIDITAIPFLSNPFQITSDEFIYFEKVLERKNISL